MLGSLSSRRQPQRRNGSSGRSVRRASENATKVPLSKKCKLDIKRKHLRAAIPGCLAVNSYAVNLQLQIDGENLPELYKCTIKKHVNNKTSCVSYRLQGTGIYNHLRGLYMRGFSSGEEPGVVVLVASSEAAPDLPYADQSDAEDADDAAAAQAAAEEDTDSEQERRPKRPRAQRQAPQRQQQQPQRPQRSRKPQRKRRRKDSDSDYEDEEEQQHQETDTEEEEEAPQRRRQAVTGPSGLHHAVYHEQLQHHEVLQHHGGAQHQEDDEDHEGQFMAAAAQQRTARQRRHARLRSHPVHASLSSPDADGGGQDYPNQPQHPHHHLAQHHDPHQQQHQHLHHEHQDHLTHHPHQHPHHHLHHHHHSVGLHAHALSGADEDDAALECGDADCVSALVGSGVEEDVAAAVAEVQRRAAQREAGSGPGPGPGSSSMPPVDPFDNVAIGVGLGVGLGGVDGLGGLSSAGPAPSALLGLAPHRDGGAVAAALHLGDDGGGGGLEADAAGHSGPQHGAPGLHDGYHAHRDVLDIPPGLSPFSPGMLHELAGRPHPHRGLGHQAQAGHVWSTLPPLDFEANNLWPDPIGLGALL